MENTGHLTTPEAIQAGLAPRLEQGALALESLLSDNQWHEASECKKVITDTGLADSTASGLLHNLVAGRVLCMRITSPHGSRKSKRAYALPIDRWWAEL